MTQKEIREQCEEYVRQIRCMEEEIQDIKNKIHQLYRICKHPDTVVTYTERPYAKVCVCSDCGDHLPLPTPNGEKR